MVASSRGPRAEKEISWLSEEPCPKRRDRLPEPVQKVRGSKVFELVKGLIGRDLAHVADLSLPAAMCEPITDMQRRGEFLHYSELLDQAAALPARSMARLLKVAAYAVSIYATINRTNPPFRSPAGETFELVAPEKGLYALGEKARELPGVNAFHCEGTGWTFAADEQNKIEFCGNHANFRPTALLRVAFADNPEGEYRWNPLVSTVHGIILGRMHITHHGTLHIRHTSGGPAAKLLFREPLLALTTAQTHQVRGHIEEDGRALPHPRLAGRWDAGLTTTHADGSQEVLFTAAPPHAHPSRYGLSVWTISLNELTPEQERHLPPSDVRRRKDVRLCEEGRYDQADMERQRLLARFRGWKAAATGPHQPRWFDLHEGVPPGMGPRYTYRGGYWETRAAVRGGAGSWEGCRDMFGP